MGSVVPKEVYVALLLFLTELDSQFGLEPVEHPVKIIASEERCLDVWFSCFSNFWLEQTYWALCERVL